MECELPRGDCSVETLGRHYGDSGKGLGGDCGETGEKWELNMERLGEKRQYEVPGGAGEQYADWRENGLYRYIMVERL